MKLQAKDLRIGNYVLIDNYKYHKEQTESKEPLKCVGICMSNNGWSISLNKMDVTKQIVSPAFSQLIEYIKPIPVTEERLLNLGFEYGKETETYWIEINGMTFELEQNEKGHFTELGYGTRVEFIHELQNIIKDLFKIELKLTP